MGNSHDHNWGILAILDTVGRIDEGIAFYAPLLADLARLLGDDHPQTLRTRSNLALEYCVVGRTDEGIQIYKQLLADRVRILGAEHPYTVKTRNDLANAHRGRGPAG